MPLSACGGRVVEIGLFLNPQLPAGDAVMAHVPELVAQADAAREVGFASL